MKRWKYPLICFLYVLPPLFWDSFFERMSSIGITLLWAFLVLGAAANMLLLHKVSVVRTGVISALLAGLLIGLTVGAVNWTPMNFNLLTELMYQLAPLFILYPPIVKMLKNDRTADGLSGAENGKSKSLIN